MRVVVGGSGRNAGKTLLIESLISAFPEARWLAVKISGHTHGAREPEFQREEKPGAETDTGRFLAAGASEAWWLRTGPDRLSEAVPQLLSLLDRFENAVIESNSIVEFMRPDLYLFVAGGERKASAERWISRADLVIPGAPASLSPEIARIVGERLSPPAEG